MGSATYRLLKLGAVSSSVGTRTRRLVRPQTSESIPLQPRSFSRDVTVVYGPTEEAHKITFLEELRDIRASVSGHWMILCDFNLILQAQDKNNDRLNRRLMTIFSRAVDDLELKEVHLNGRAFTWTSTRESPTLARIDDRLGAPFPGLFSPRPPFHGFGPLSAATVLNIPFWSQEMFPV